MHKQRDKDLPQKGAALFAFRHREPLAPADTGAKGENEEEIRPTRHL